MVCAVILLLNFGYQTMEMPFCILKGSSVHDVGDSALHFTFYQRIEICKLRQGEHLILGFSIGGGIDQDPGQNPFSEDKSDKGIYVTRVTPGGPAEVAGLMMGDKVMQVNGWDMTMVTHDQARKRLTKKNEDIVRLLVTRKSLEQAVRHSMM
uniref:Tax1-binding protein 3 n=1 Tax=Oncorhynchus mykiss TaxID=8022 RepID=A0A8C7LNV5_ONCMY